MQTATVSISDVRVQPDKLVKARILVSSPSPTDGIGFLAIEVEDPSIATIQDVDVRARGTVDGAYTPGEAFASIDNWQVDGLSTEVGASNEMVLAVVFLRGQSDGETAITISDVRDFRRSDGGNFSVAREHGRIRVGESGVTGFSLDGSDRSVSGGSVPLYAHVEHGLDALDMEIEARDGLTITDATVPAELSDVSVSDDGSSLRFAGVGYGASAGRVRIATLDVDASEGRHKLDLTPIDAGSLDGRAYRGLESVSLTVRVSGEGPSPPTVIGDKPVTDPDGDGLYEDIDGNGEFSVVDVSAFLNNFRTDVVQNNVDLFDFNGDGSVNIVDASSLLSEL